MTDVCDGVIRESIWTNCSGSSELGSDGQMSSLTSCSKHFMATEVTAIGRSRPVMREVSGPVLFDQQLKTPKYSVYSQV